MPPTPLKLPSGIQCLLHKSLFEVTRAYLCQPVVACNQEVLALPQGSGNVLQTTPPCLISKSPGWLFEDTSLAHQDHSWAPYFCRQEKQLRAGFTKNSLYSIDRGPAMGFKANVLFLYVHVLYLYIYTFLPNTLLLNE